MHGRPARLCFKIINASHNRPSPRVPEQRELALFPPPTPPRAAPRRLVVRCCRGPIRHPLPPSLSPLVTRQPIRPTTPRFFLLLFLLLPPPACQSRYPLRFRCCSLSVLRRRVSFSLSVSLWCETDILGGGGRGSKLSFLIRLGRIVGVFDRA